MGKGIGKVAVKYARALLQNVEGTPGASGRSEAQELAKKLEELALTFDSNRDLHNALLSPMFSEAERLNALNGICEAMGLPEIARKFLKLVAQRGRLPILSEIALSFSELADRAAAVVTVEVITARSISSDEQNEIARSLSSIVKGRLEFQWRVDPSILGGMLVRYGGKVLDGTLRTRLDRVEQSLLQ